MPFSPVSSEYLEGSLENSVAIIRRENRREMPKILEFPKVIETLPERRRFRRYQVNLRCIIKVLGSPNLSNAVLFVGEAVNGSRGGFFFVTKDSAVWEVGAEIECLIQLPAKSGDRMVAMRCWGKVVRLARQEGGRVGVGAMMQDVCLPAIITEKSSQTLPQKSRSLRSRLVA